MSNGDKENRAKAAQEVHEKAKQAITDRQSSSFKTLLALEGAGETLIVAILGALKVLLGLLIVPDVTASKIAAAILGIGISIFLIGLAAYIIFTSLTDFKEIRDETAEAEKTEDDRYQKAIKDIYGTQ